MSAVRPPVGIALQPEPGFWHAHRELIEDRAELFEITPETLWAKGCEPGPGHAEALAFARRCGRPFVGHGVGFSLGATTPPARRQQWLAALQRDRAAFGMQWFGEHLGFADAAGLHTAWPLPLPCSDAAVAVVTAALCELRAVHPLVAFENNADLVCLGDPLAQPRLFDGICRAADAWLVLDLHNGYAFCRNVGADFDGWLDALPWDRVLEIHLSGGHDTAPGWLPDGSVMRMDSHDDAVPPPVWRAFDRALPRAPALRAVVVEWMHTGHAADVTQLARDVARAQEMVC